MRPYVPSAAHVQTRISALNVSRVVVLQMCTLLIPGKKTFRGVYTVMLLGNVKDAALEMAIYLSSVVSNLTYF